MNLTSSVAVVACVAAVASAFISDDLYAEIKANAPWDAVQHHPRFHNMTLDDIKRGLLTSTDIYPDPSLPVIEHTHADLGAIPSNYTIFTNGTVTPNVKNQGNCGSCWAFSASSVLGYRFGVQQKSEAVDLSPQQLVSCDNLDMGCNGGQQKTAWYYMKVRGMMQDECYPYVSGATGRNGACSATCTSTSFTDSHRYHAANLYKINSLTSMRVELMERGPIQAAMMVYKDLLTYAGGIYTHVSGPAVGGHAVTVVGFGEENGRKYWVVQNSWGEDWGIKINGRGGFFKIAIGSCGISYTMVAGLPGPITK